MSKASPMTDTVPPTSIDDDYVNRNNYPAKVFDFRNQMRVCFPACIAEYRKAPGGRWRLHAYTPNGSNTIAIALTQPGTKITTQAKL